MKLSLSALTASLSLVALTAMAQPAPAPAGAPMAKPVHAGAQVPAPDAAGPRGPVPGQAGAPAPGPRGDEFPILREQALKRAAEQFDVMDTNRDGKLTHEEVQAFREKMMQQFNARQAQGPRGNAPAGMERQDRRVPPGSAQGMPPPRDGQPGSQQPGQPRQ